ncbi:MAG TPA: DUF1330 domain-containing protein [Candidatus Binatia bacterium]|nr:DUF1330 domain-containing protein [Candidatus Binatia bacterium]
MTIELYPTPSQMQALLSGPDDEPVVMLNLLRFKPEASEPDEGATGEEAYGCYSAAMLEFIGARGARVLWTGRVVGQVIGSGAEGFHTIALVEYPSRRAFFEIASHPHVRDIGVHRAAGLEGQWLVAAVAR